MTPTKNGQALGGIIPESPELMGDIEKDMESLRRQVDAGYRAFLKRRGLRHTTFRDRQEFGFPKHENAE